MNVCSNVSLVCHVYIFPLCIDSDGGLKQSIHSNVIDVTFSIFSSSSVPAMTLITAS